MTESRIEMKAPAEGAAAIFRVTMPDAPTVDMLDELLEELLDAAAERAGAMVVIMDARKIRPTQITALHRRRVATYFRSITDAHGSNFGGQVLVFTNPVKRGILTAVTWMFSPPWPLRIVPHLHAAEDHAATLLSDRLRMRA